MQTSTANRRTIIDRFPVSGEKGYSEFWRRNKSPVEVYELANLLSGLRKVASFVGSNVGKIVFSGMDAQNAISIDPRPVLGKYPVPATLTDQMIGKTVRLAYQKTEWTERFKELFLAKIDLPAQYAFKYQLFFNMSERIYLDCLSNRSVLGYYTECDRKQSIKNTLCNWTHPPTINELLHIWWDLAADRKGKEYKKPYVDQSFRGQSSRTSLEKFYKEPVALLNSIVDKLIYECPRIFGVTERGNYRMDLYFSIWPQLFEMIRYWATDSDDPYLQPHYESAEFLGIDDYDEETLKPIFFAKEVEEATSKKTFDFTERIKEVLENAEEVVTMKENDIVMPTRNFVNKKLMHNLKFVIKTVAQKKTIFNRGLKTGKIDRRRLYRASTTGMIFQMTKSDFELLNDIILLVDATGSMAAPNKWEKAEEIFQTLFSAISAYNKNARIFAYNEVKGICHITELYLKDQFYSILPHGKTASGEAIITTTFRFNKGNKRPFIIHLTDGASNWGCGVKNAIELCRKKGINLLTLGMGCVDSNKKLLRDEYGDRVRFIDDISTLPSLLRDLLNRSKWRT